MPRNLHDRASTQLDLHRAAEQQVKDSLVAARLDRDLRHEDPDSVAITDWSTSLGATQHLEVALQALSDLRQDEADIRARLRDIDNPADAATHEAELRDVMVADAAMRVSVRDARERKERAQTLDDRLSGLLTRIEAGVRAAEERLTWATEHQDGGDALRDAMAAAPLDTVVADATAALADAAYTDADARLGDLVPDELRDRAAERATEAVDHVDQSTEHQDGGLDSLGTLVLDSSPLAGAAANAMRAFLGAQGALQHHVRTAAADLEQATDDLTPIADLADLTTAQFEALDSAANADGVAAVAAEQALVAALTPVEAAQRALDDAIVAALTADPDVDPETEAGVISARSTLEGAALQDPLTTARAGYGATEQADLDAWEVEVPVALWDAVGAFLDAERTLERLADQTVHDALLTDFDDAQDTLADALDEVDIDIRRRWAVEAALADRAAALEAALSTRTDRRSQYTRGDGPSGRTPEEL